jgi:lipopolysaccharide transport system ATP-binding protein
MSTVLFQDVSKKFTLRKQRSASFQELFLDFIRGRRRASREEFWAVHRVSFAIEPGEMVGIIGSNGAGKSTVLKLMTRILEPTSGRIRVGGRIGALLELGTGFHPDLTGRENIYLNGSIVGIKRAQIDHILDDIVAFSELERFIDIPVKHYSSGMYMRLGFSIAIHVQPEILLVDEVLAVGDQSFQLRCLDKIHEMKREGVSIVLITHDLNVVREMCDRAIWMDEGSIRGDGSVEQVLDQYLTLVNSHDEQALFSSAPGHTVGLQETGKSSEDAKSSEWRWGSREAEIVRVQILDGGGQERRAFHTGEPLSVRMAFSASHRIERPQFGLALYHSSGFHINGPNTVFAGLDIEAIQGSGTVEYRVPSLPLLPGTYLLSVALYNHEGTHPYDHHHQAYTFRVRPCDAIREEFGSIYIPATWHLGPPVEGA